MNDETPRKSCSIAIWFNPRVKNFMLNLTDVDGVTREDAFKNTDLCMKELRRFYPDMLEFLDKHRVKQFLQAVGKIKPDESHQAVLYETSSTIDLYADYTQAPSTSTSKQIAVDDSGKAVIHDFSF